MMRWVVVVVLVGCSLGGCGRYQPPQGAEAEPESPWAHRAVSADLPTAAQVSRIFPAHAGTRLDVGYISPQPASGFECQADFAITSTVFLSGRWGSYGAVGEEGPYFRGEPEPTVFIYAFASGAQAKAALRAARDMVRRCTGENLANGIKATTQPLTRLPDGHVGSRTHMFTENLASPTEVSEDYFTDVFAVKDNFLVETRIQDATSFPSQQRIAALAKLATSTVGTAARPQVHESADAKLIDFRRDDPYGGFSIQTSEDIQRITGVSPGFRATLARELAAANAASCLPLLVQTYRTDGFARTMRGSCGYEDPGQYEIWAATKDRWHRVDSATSPESFNCEKLEKARIPVGVALDWCAGAAEGVGTEYPRR